MAESPPTKVPKVLSFYKTPCILPSGTFKVKCKYCDKEISGSRLVTTNWWKHLRKVHAGFVRSTQEKDPKNQVAPLTLNPSQPRKKYDSKSPIQNKATEKLVDFLTHDVIPLSIVESTNFQSFVSTLDPQYVLPSRKHLSTTLLKNKYEKIKNGVMIKLRDTDSLCLTIDIWSNRQIQSFLGLTAHYISSQWTFESVMLRCKRVIGPHISENITLWYEETVSDFDIGHKVKYIITDSALNMKKAFREIRLADFDDEDNGLFNYDCDTEEEYYKEEFDINVEMGNNIADIPFPQHVCFAHTLQLVVKDGLSKNGLDVSGIALKKCFELVASIRKSTIIAPDLLKDEKQRPQSDNITKWLKMIRSVLSISDDKLSSLQGVSKLTSYERLALNDLLDILSPFEEATDAVQLSKGPSAGYILPCIKGLTHHINNKISKYNSSVISNLKQSLVKRMSYYEESEAYLLAALLDPRFKTKWCSSDDEKNKFNNLLKKAVSTVDDSQSFSSTPPQSFSIKQPPVKKKKTLFSFMIDEKEEDYVPGRNHMANKEVKDYLESVTLEMIDNPAEFWRSNSKKYPLLSKLAKEFLGIPSSSAPVERLFSVAGNIFRVERCQLTDARFEQLIFIRCNNR